MPTRTSTSATGTTEPASATSPGPALRWPALRWPAEWEPHAATWLAWPHNRDTWPGRLSRAESEFAGFVRALQDCEPIRLLVADAAMEAHARQRLAEAGADPERGIHYLHVPTDDAWIRDYGPVFVRRRGARQVGLAFRFDSWDRKYPPWDRDDDDDALALRQLGLPGERADFVLEGGSVDGNGCGTLLTTESCLLNPNREPGRTRKEMRPTPQRLRARRRSEVNTVRRKRFSTSLVRRAS